MGMRQGTLFKSIKNNKGGEKVLGADIHFASPMEDYLILTGPQFSICSL